MASDAEARHELHERLNEAVGESAAGTLMQALPPYEWDKLATKDDLVALEQRLEERFDHRLERLEGRVNHRFDLVQEELGHRIDTVQEDLGHRIDLGHEEYAARISSVEERVDKTKHELIGVVRGELLTQARMGYAASIVSAVATAGLVIAAIKL